MPNFTTQHEIKELDRSLMRADFQRKMVSSMRTGDPNLLQACALLRQMEQSAAMAKISLALTSYNYIASEYNPFSL